MRSLRMAMPEWDPLWEKRRRWARRFTMTFFFAFLILGTPNFVGCVLHARVDSEVGGMNYGLPLLIGIVWGAPVLGVSTLIWGLGLRKARRRGETIPLTERGCFAAIATVLAIILVALAGQFF
jgi:hypothetical protein